MSNIAIKVENLSKAYQLGEIGTGTLSRDLERWWARLRGKEDPFLKIGQTNDRTTKADKGEVVWSLRDINFEIEQGQAVGIIGRNGAGKSTLLKILSRVTSPTTGSVKLKGRVASLLEVGTGFHPELTGRENIYLNGAILGMRKAEIKRKFDEIVDFAGVEIYIDTPVKRYSSGMYVRLAFAVAAHLESEILIVDEVLAVGDAEFQKKCLGKMGDVSSKEGRTVLFVSHNMGAVRYLCNSCLILESGKLIHKGTTFDALKYYLEEYAKIKNTANTVTGLGKKVIIKNIFTDNLIASGEDLKIKLEIESDILLLTPHISIIIEDEFGTRIATFYNYHEDNQIQLFIGTNKISCNIPKMPLVKGKYYVSVWISENGIDTLEYFNNLLEIIVEEDFFFKNSFQANKQLHGIVNIKNYWLNEL